MNKLNELPIRPLISPFLYMLGFYIILNIVSTALVSLFFSHFFRTGGTFHGIGVGIPASVINLVIQTLIGLLFIWWMGDGLQNHGFTLKSPHLYILPAIILGVGVAVVRTAMSLSFQQIHPGMNAFHSPAIYSLIWAAPLNGLGGAVNAFLFCGVMQEYISRRADGHVRMLRRNVPLAGIAVSLIVVLLPVLQFIIFFLLHRPAPSLSGLASTLVSGAAVLIYSYWYDRSRSLAAPVIADSLAGILSGVLYFLAVSVLFSNQMR